MRDPSALQVESFLEMMSAERGAATNTLQSYERDLEDARSFLNERGVRLAEAAPDDLRAYLGHLARQGFAASSQARRLSALRQFFKFLYGEGLRGDDPTGILDAPKKGRSLPKTLSVDDVTRLIARAEAEAARARICCLSPIISTVSSNTARPLAATSRSKKAPIVGLPARPEVPSEPPHSQPTVRSANVMGTQGVSRRI